MADELKSLLLNLGQRIENHWDEVRHAVKRELGWLDPVTIMPYRGYGDAARLRLSVGVQLVGRRCGDHGLLAVASRLEGLQRAARG